MNKKGTEAGFFFFEERTEAGLHALYKRGQKKILRYGIHICLPFGHKLIFLCPSHQPAL
jgi:hypothetical protein